MISASPTVKFNVLFCISDTCFFKAFFARSRSSWVIVNVVKCSAAARKAAVDAGIGWSNVNWGDVLAAVADGAATVTNYIATSITGGFQLTVTTLVNGVTYV